MHILYACDYLVHDRRRISFLRKKHRVSVLSFRSTLSSPKSVSNGQNNWFYPFDGRIPLFVRGLFALPIFRRISIVEKPDVICASWIWGYPYLAYLSRLKPLVAIVVGSEILLENTWNALVRTQMKRTLEYANAIVVDATYVKTQVHPYVDGEEKIFRIPVGVDTSLFHKTNELRNEIRNNLGMTDDEVLVICNRWHKPVYGIENLIRAIPKLILKTDKIRFLIIGSGPLTQIYKRIVSQLKVSSYVNFVPEIPDTEMPKYLSAADIYVSPSLSDGTSVSLLEAMSCELPVVVTNLPAIREWVLDGENGLLIERSHPSLIAKGIMEMLSLRSKWQRIGRENRNLIKKKAEINTTINKLEEAYRFAIEHA